MFGCHEDHITRGTIHSQMRNKKWLCINTPIDRVGHTFSEGLRIDRLRIKYRLLRSRAGASKTVLSSENCHARLNWIFSKGYPVVGINPMRNSATASRQKKAQVRPPCRRFL